MGVRSQFSDKKALTLEPGNRTLRTQAPLGFVVCDLKDLFSRWSQLSSLGLVPKCQAWFCLLVSLCTSGNPVYTAGNS